MKSLAYDLARAELDMLLDCVACNQVTASAATVYKSRAICIVADASEEASSEEHEELQILEASTLSYIDQQIDKYTKALAQEESLDLQSAFASVPNVTCTASGVSVPCTYHVVLSRLDNTRLKRVIEATENIPKALHVIKGMSDNTETHVSYDLTPDSLAFIKHTINGMSQDRTAKALRKAFGSLL